jgi:hypothetical protein
MNHKEKYLLGSGRSFFFSGTTGVKSSGKIMPLLKNLSEKFEQFICFLAEKDFFQIEN